MGPPTTTKVSDTCMTHVRQTRHFEITLSAPEGPKVRNRQLISPPRSQPKNHPPGFSSGGPLLPATALPISGRELMAFFTGRGRGLTGEI